MSKEKPTLGIFFCDCGGELSQVIDFPRLSEFASKLQDVKFVKRHSFLCGDEGRKEIDALIQKGADRIVIAACSPKLYEPLFRNYLTESKFNPYCLEMANLREQCAWPHADDPKGANEKAKRLVEGAVERARKITPIEKKEFKVNKSVLVIGAGIAGLQAAIDVADFGLPVHLIERAPVVGGNALKLGLAFPAEDGAFCISSPEFLKGIRKCFYRAGLLQHPNLKLYTLSEVKEVKGSFGNFEVKVVSQPRGVEEKLCTNCGKCTDVCPIEVADEMNYGLSKRKAIYLPYPNAVPPVYVIDWENCNKCGECVNACPTKAVDLSGKAKETTLKAGIIIVATGFQEYDPSEIKPYRYGVYEDVITQLQLARILDPYGPTGGKLVKPSSGETPKNVVMIQCVGSRDETTNPYCSKICCTLALKHAIHIKEEYGQDVDLHFCYMDIRTLGKGYEEYFSKARKLGVNFIRGKPSEITKDPTSGSLLVEVEDTLLNRPLEIEADMVILSVALRPTAGSGDLAKLLKIEVGNYGFIKEIYPKLKNIETSTKGIYVCGGAQGPKDIPESINQAEAVAFRAVLNLSKDKFTKDLDVAQVSEEDCDGCEVCVEVCPYDAIQMVEAKDKPPVGLVAKINEFLCERCGSCADRCPTGAIQLSYWTDDQFSSQIGGLLSKNGGSMSPKVIAFCCDECGYATVDLAGMGEVSYPANVLPMRVPCLGWISLYHIFKTFEFGADGILLVGCLFPNCQHLKGNVYAERAVTFAKSILDEIGLSSRRLKMVSVCAADPEEFSRAAKSFVDDIKELGPVMKK
jgi:heterodisulfide reductase subunit A